MRQIEFFHASIFIDVIGPVAVANVNAEINAQKHYAISLVNSTLLFAVIVVFHFLLVLLQSSLDETQDLNEGKFTLWK